jgi:D-alanine transaminase
MPEIAYVNGCFSPIGEAVVSVEDRGFQYADGVYEVLATYGGEPHGMEEHLLRLERSLGELRIECDIREYGLEGIIREAIARAGFKESLIYVQITRGVAPRRHEFPLASSGVSPTVVLTVKELARPQASWYETGVKVVTSPDLRWKRCDIKTVALLPNVLAKQQAAEAGAFEALLVDETGRVTEGSSTSSFRVLDGEIWTTPLGGHILRSITRDALLRVARDLGIAVREEFSLLEDYLQADEVFLAGTTAESIPVVQIDDTAIGSSGAPGPVTMRLRAAFLEMLS